jgi:hypothetical protein
MADTKRSNRPAKGLSGSHNAPIGTFGPAQGDAERKETPRCTTEAYLRRWAKPRGGATAPADLHVDGGGRGGGETSGAYRGPRCGGSLSRERPRRPGHVRPSTVATLRGGTGASPRPQRVPWPKQCEHRIEEVKVSLKMTPIEPLLPRCRLTPNSQVAAALMAGGGKMPNWRPTAHRRRRTRCLAKPLSYPQERGNLLRSSSLATGREGVAALRTAWPEKKKGT